MGNTNNKKTHYSHGKYASQCSLSDILAGGCVRPEQSFHEEFKPWSRVSRRRWSECTLNDKLSCSKTAWPVARFEAIFLPEFKVRSESLKTEFFFVDAISNGAYGRVYKVQRQDDKRVYALKVIDKAKVVAENAVAQAKQEVAIQQAVGHHPFIARLPEHWQNRKKLYILTDYIGGGELYSLVEEYGFLQEDIVRIYVAEIALAIDFLHNAGVIHRDVKATNVLLDDEGHAILIDFGFAKWLQPRHKTGTLCGTPDYMAPEIAKKEHYGHEVDWWSLGVLACFLLTGRYPASAVADFLPEKKSLNYAPPGTLPAEVQRLSVAALDLLKRLLQPKPLTRLHSVLALQRIAFYMGCNFEDYRNKTVSPFELLGRRTRQEELVPNMRLNEFSDFDSFATTIGAKSCVESADNVSVHV